MVAYLQSFPVSESFLVSRLVASVGQNIGTSASAAVLPMNIQGSFPLGLTGLIHCCPRESPESSLAPQFKSINSLLLSLLSGPTLTSYMATGKTIALTSLTFVGKGMSLLFDMLSRFLMTLFSKGQASFNFMAEVTICSDFGTQKNKV